MGYLALDDVLEALAAENALIDIFLPFTSSYILELFSLQIALMLDVEPSLMLPFV
jgi:hypothetical protein